MPDNREYQNNADSSPSNVSAENQSLDEGMRRLKLENNHEEIDAYSNPYPYRPGEPDCLYYMRTGSCGYGRNCRYNHPNYAAQGTLEKGELPERGGQPDCQHFLKTGVCKYGMTCKYNHPREKHEAQAVPLNVLGFPLRQDEKSCQYYLRTGTCKYGVVCKFNHPQPATIGTVYPLSEASAYGSTGSPVVAMSNSSVVGGSAWPISNGPSYISTSDMQNLQAYMPVIVSPTLGTLPMQQGWTAYTGSVSHASPADTPSRTESLPERPDQPECQHYLRTGRCKYGSACKYHHPRERNPSSTTLLGPLGLPLRPGNPICSFYSYYGTCKYGSACRFDHPVMGYYNYNYNLPRLSYLHEPTTTTTTKMETKRTVESSSPSYATGASSE